MYKLAMGLLAKAEGSIRIGSDLLGMRAGVMPLSTVIEPTNGSGGICLYTSPLQQVGSCGEELRMQDDSC